MGIFQSGSGGERTSIDGIVYKVTNEELTIAFNEMHDFVSSIGFSAF